MRIAARRRHAAVCLLGVCSSLALAVAICRWWTHQTTWHGQATGSRGHVSHEHMRRFIEAQFEREHGNQWRISSANHTSCHSPPDNVVFLKTHKCASSSVQNLLLRRGLRRRLLFALYSSPTDHLRLGWPQRFDPALLQGVSRSNGELHIPRCNVLCHHIVFSLDEVSRVMLPGARYFSIIRHPAHMFESMYDYGRYHQYFNASLYTFAINPQKYLMKRESNWDSVLGTLRNPILFDFGATEKDPLHRCHNDASHLYPMFKLILLKFPLILLSEYYDESLILLKHYLCWPLEDLVGLQLNRRAAPRGIIRRPNVVQRRSKLEAMLRGWNTADFLFYEMAHYRLLKQMSEFGLDQLDKEVLELRRLRQDIINRCRIYNLTNKAWDLPINTLGFATDINSKECRWLVSPEKALTRVTWNRQRDYYQRLSRARVLS